MNIIRNAIFFFIACGVFSSCSQKAENKRVSFKDNVISRQFKMSQLYEEKYDSFYIIPPYFYDDSIPNHIVIDDDLKNYCIKKLRMNDKTYIMLLTVSNHVTSYSVINRDDVWNFHLPYYKGISMEKTLYMSKNRYIYAE